MLCHVSFLIPVCAVLVNIMMEDSNDLLLESTRVCGNLSRYPDVRDLLVGCKGRYISVVHHRALLFSLSPIKVNGCVSN